MADTLARMSGSAARVAYENADAERRQPEPGKPGDEREPWEIDRARILHSAAFRRLQGKTQVFAPGEADFFRTRLTHSIEVSQIAKGIALRVGANPTLCEAASLAHDIGHPPFGHAGERVLNECMSEAGGFEGNAQNLRVLATIEVKSHLYAGLNLTRATLDAILKYKRSRTEALAQGLDKYFYDADMPLVEWICQGNRDAGSSFECQVMEWADDVAYSVHDVEDGIWAGLISNRRLRQPGLRDAVLAECPEASPAVLDGVLAEIHEVLHPETERARKAARKTWSSNVIYQMVHAARAVPTEAGTLGPRYSSRLEVDPAMVLKSGLLKAISQRLLFDHPRVRAVQERAQRVIGSLFALLTSPGAESLLPEDLRDQIAQAGTSLPRLACDYISGMTDGYAIALYRRKCWSVEVISNPEELRPRTR